MADFFFKERKEMSKIHKLKYGKQKYFGGNEVKCGLSDVYFDACSIFWKEVTCKRCLLKHGRKQRRGFQI